VAVVAVGNSCSVSGVGCRVAASVVHTHSLWSCVECGLPIWRT